MYVGRVFQAEPGRGTQAHEGSSTAEQSTGAADIGKFTGDHFSWDIGEIWLFFSLSHFTSWKDVTRRRTSDLGCETSLWLPAELSFWSVYLTTLLHCLKPFNKSPLSTKSFLNSLRWHGIIWPLASFPATCLQPSSFIFICALVNCLLFLVSCRYPALLQNALLHLVCFGEFLFILHYSAGKSALLWSLFWPHGLFPLLWSGYSSFHRVGLSHTVLITHSHFLLVSPVHSIISYWRSGTTSYLCVLRP